jgi:hypothetical protein
LVTLCWYVNISFDLILNFRINFLASCFGSLIFVALPILRTKLTQLVEINEYAIVFIAAGIIETIGHEAIGIISNNIYKSSVKFFPGLVFLIFASTGIFPLIIIGYD